MKTSISQPGRRTAAMAIRARPAARLLACGWISLVFFATAVAAAGAPGAAPGLRVRILLYSGRPDPVFVITDAASIAEVKHLLDQAAPEPAEGGAGKTAIPSILGYKGIRVENRDGLGGLPRTFAVYKGRVETRDHDTRFLSQGNALESFLIDEAVKAKVLDDRAVEEIRAARGDSAAPKP